MTVEPVTIQLVGGLAAAIGAAVAAYLGYASSKRRTSRMQRNLEKVLGDQSLISQFETANNTVLEIKNSIENRKLSEEDIRQVVSMMTKVEDLYKTIIKHADAAAKRETRGAAG